MEIKIGDFEIYIRTKDIEQTLIRNSKEKRIKTKRPYKHRPGWHAKTNVKGLKIKKTKYKAEEDEAPDEDETD